MTPSFRMPARFRRSRAILHQHGDVGAGKGIGNLLHEEGVGAGTGADPNHVHPVFDALQHVFFRGYLRAYLHTVGFLHLPQPFEAGGAYAFKGARMGTGLPNAGPIYVDAKRVEAFGCFHYLFFGLCTAGTGNAHGPRKGEKTPFRARDNI